MNKNNRRLFDEARYGPRRPVMELDLGHGVIVRLDDDRGGLIWKHPACRAWATLRFQPDPQSTGHRLIALEPLTIVGSLLCPMGCGTHGTVEEGRWKPC
jgi:hypothetical protein